MKVQLEKWDYMEDWYLINRAEHDGSEWDEHEDGSRCDNFRTCRYHTHQACHSRRLGNADIEGTAEHMRDIAYAIERNQSHTEKRVRAEFCHSDYLLSSPRNSREPTLISHEEALDLARQIRSLLG